MRQGSGDVPVQHRVAAGHAAQSGDNLGVEMSRREQRIATGTQCWGRRLDRARSAQGKPVWSIGQGLAGDPHLGVLGLQGSDPLPEGGQVSLQTGDRVARGDVRRS
jgi:hypothetical protein